MLKENLHVLLAFAAMGLFAGYLVAPLWSGRAAQDRFVSISATAIELGEISAYEQASKTIEISNHSPTRLDFKFEVDCSCTSVAPGVGSVEPGSKQLVEVFYKPKGLSAESLAKEESSLLLSTFGEGGEDRFPISVTALVAKPIAIDESNLTISIPGLSEHGLKIPFTKVDSSITSFAVLDIPEFLNQAEVVTVNEEFGAYEFVGEVKPGGDGTKSGDLILIAEPGLKFALPLKCISIPPFTLSSDSVCLHRGESARVAVSPMPHIAKLTVQDIQVDSAQLLASSSGPEISILAKDNAEACSAILSFLVLAETESGQSAEYRHVVSVVVSSPGA